MHWFYNIEPSASIWHQAPSYFLRPTNKNKCDKFGLGLPSHPSNTSIFSVPYPFAKGNFFRLFKIPSVVPEFYHTLWDKSTFSSGVSRAEMVNYNVFKVPGQNYVIFLFLLVVCWHVLTTVTNVRDSAHSEGAWIPPHNRQNNQSTVGCCMVVTPLTSRITVKSSLHVMAVRCRGILNFHD